MRVEDFQKILDGVVLEDGVVQVDHLVIIDDTRKRVGVEIHMGKNRVIRRLFASLNYSIEKLDRVLYAHLTKKALPRGKWRFLAKQEVVRLKYLHTRVCTKK